MIDRITVGASSLMAALVAATGLVRWAVVPPRGRGRHRAPEYIEVPLAGLMPAWPEPTTIPIQLGTQAFRLCKPCGGEVAVVVHGNAHRCEHGHVTITAGAA